MLSIICCSLATFGNTPKVDTKATMNENKKKNRMDHGVQCLHFSKEIYIYIYNIKLRGRKVVLYVDQRGCVNLNFIVKLDTNHLVKF